MVSSNFNSEKVKAAILSRDLQSFSETCQAARQGEVYRQEFILYLEALPAYLADGACYMLYLLREDELAESAFPLGGEPLQENGLLIEVAG